VNPILLPRLTDSWEAFVDLLASGSYWPALRITLSELLTAFVIAASLGCVIGYMVSRTRFTVRMFDPFFAGLYSIPAILLFPLYVLFFGIGEGSKIAIGATIAFFPVVLNTIAGFDYVDRTYVRAAKSMGASPVQMFWSVMLPAAFPVVLTGLRIGFILAFLSILGTETISSLGGLGHQIVTYSERIEPAKMYAYIFLAIVIAFLLNLFVSALERRARRGRG
jgi:ABC-type nitrate/sulfonate/bicarbonate transport system permease component